MNFLVTAFFETECLFNAWCHSENEARILVNVLKLAGNLNLTRLTMQNHSRRIAPEKRGEIILDFKILEGK